MSGTPPLVSRVLATRGVKGDARMVLVVIASHVGRNSEAWPSVATIARESECSERTVYRALRSLEQSGILRVDRTPGGPSHYAVVLPGDGSGTPDRMSPPRRTQSHPTPVADVTPTPDIRSGRTSSGTSSEPLGSSVSRPSLRAREAPAGQPAIGDVPDENDSAAYAARLLTNGGRWLGNLDWTAAWADLDRRFSSEWVREAIDAAFAELSAADANAKPWSLVHRAEWRLANRTRREDALRKQVREADERREAYRLRQMAAEAAPEQRRAAALAYRITHIFRERWREGEPMTPIPTDASEQEAWLRENDPEYDPAAFAVAAFAADDAEPSA